ncbi:MAG: sulfotransferase, partial [Pseudomonadota bacterium]
EYGLGSQDQVDVLAANDWLDEHAAEPPKAVFGTLATWTAPARLVDKSPLYTLHDAPLKRIARAFPEARYLHLTRSPDAASRSIARLRQDLGARLGRATASDESRAASDLERFWVEPHRRVCAFLDSVPEHRQRRVRGEDLLTDPPTELRRIARWLDLSDATPAIEAMCHPERWAFASAGPRAARFGCEPGFHERPARRPPGAAAPAAAPLSREAAALARHFGYADGHPESPASSSTALTSVIHA